MSIKEIAKAVRQELKTNHKITSKQVSVRGRSAGYSNALDVVIKDLSVPKQLVKQIAYHYESVRYDEASGEILSGGNVYIHVDYDHQAVADKSEDYLDIAENILKEINNTKAGYSATVATNLDKNVDIFYNPDTDCLIVQEADYLKDIRVPSSRTYCYRSAEAIAKALVQLIDCQQLITLDHLRKYIA